MKYRIEKNKSTYKVLVLAISAALLSGGSVYAADYSSPIFNRAVTEYQNAGVQSGETYTFSGNEDVNINVTAAGSESAGYNEYKYRGMLAINNYQDSPTLSGITINAPNKNLNVSINSDNTAIIGMDFTLGDIKINTSKVSLILNNVAAGKSSSYYLTGMRSIQNGRTLTINGDFVGDFNSKARTIGAQLKDRAELNFNGDVEMTVNKDAAKFSALFDVEQSAVANVNMDKDGTIGNHTVKLNGDIKTTTTQRVFGNPDGISEGSKSVGTVNIGLVNAQSYWNGLSGYSNFKDNSGSKKWSVGQVNLAVQNGAVWTNERYSNKSNPTVVSDKIESFGGSVINKLIGGDSEDKAGVIYQKDKRPILINSYSGHDIFVLDHAAIAPTSFDDLGDIKIKKAAANSEIIMRTSSAGVTEANKHDVLNALAKKLYYEEFVDGATNLSGKAEIAEGLTSSSIEKKFAGTIKFMSKDGQGLLDEEIAITPPLPKPEPEAVQSTITGVPTTDKWYVDQGIYKSNTKTYEYTADGSVALDKNQPAVDAKDMVTIDASGHNLVLSTTGTVAPSQSIYAVGSSAGKYVNITANDIKISTNTEEERAEGIHVTSPSNTERSDIGINGNTDLYAHGKTKAFGAYVTGVNRITFKGDITSGTSMSDFGVSTNVEPSGEYGFYAESGLYAGADYNQSAGGTIKVTGNTTLFVEGNGAMANGWSSAIDLGKNVKISIKKNNETPFYSLVVQNGRITANYNYYTSQPGEGTVVLNGNIGTLNGSVFNDNEDLSKIYVALVNDQSQLNGVLVDNYRAEQIAKNQKGYTKIYLQNGAIWNNEKYGSTIAEFHGSKVDELIGGTSAANAGVIHQMDTNPITVKMFSGFATLVYDHDEATPTTFAGGNTTIEKAATGSAILMRTSPNGVTADNKNDVLNALANKLYYSEYATGTKNLTGTLEIAEGLTASSTTQVFNGKMVFDKNGMGMLDKSTPQPTPEPTPQPTPEPTPQPTPEPTPQPMPQPGRILGEGDYENSIMKGVRSATTASDLAWRTINNAGMTRIYTDQGKQVEGPWARLTSDKYEINHSVGTVVLADANNTVGTDSGRITYTAKSTTFMAGYDRALSENMMSRLGITYTDGTQDLLNHGVGKLKAFALFGQVEKALPNNIFITAKAMVGKVKNDFELNSEGNPNAITSKTLNHHLPVSHDASVFGLGLGIAKHISTSDGGYVIPEAKIIYSHVQGEDVTSVSSQGATLQTHFAPYNSVIGHLGVKFGKTFDKGNVFAKASILHEFAGKVANSYYAKDGGAKAVESSGKDTWAQIQFGATYDFASNIQFQGYLIKDFGGAKKNDWVIGGRINYRF